MRAAYAIGCRCLPKYSNKFSRHDFTLDVFVQEGEFWNAIDQLRSRWAVVPRRGIPEFSEAFVCLLATPDPSPNEKDQTKS